MALKIIRSNEPIEVKQLVVAIYSNPGIGKTTLAFSSESPLLLDFDKGSYRANIRGDVVQINEWSGVSEITEDDLKDYKTIIVDTAGRALDFLTLDIIKKNPKLGYSGALTLQGYGQLKARFTSWLTMLKHIGKDVILIAHSSEEKNGDDIIERLDIQGGSKGEIYKSADAMGRLSIVNGHRMLNFSPTDTYFGKNPASLDPLKVPEINSTGSFLSDVIQTIKDKLNNLTEAQTERQARIADWMAKIEEGKNADHFNKLVPDVQKCDPDIVTVVKGYLHKVAIDSGLSFDKKKKEYVEAA